MLEAMDVLSTAPDSILIGYRNNTEENAKAEGNQKGSYGRSPDSSKQRKFLGVTKSELNTILKQVSKGNQ